MSWGDALASAVGQASDAARQAAGQMMASAANAAQAVGRAAQAARDAVAERVSAAAQATATAARAGANMASFAGRAAADAATIAARKAVSAATAPYRAAKRLMAPARPPAATLVEPCPDGLAGKKARLEQRQQKISDGQRSPDPAVRNAASRLAENNLAVELARLSDDAYAQYAGDGPTEPPVGWRRIEDAALREKGVDPERLQTARAVMYETPDDWPGGKKTVLAFRGTDGLEDGIVDHDQAMALETRQYRAAVRLGSEVGDAYGSSTLVTGHSLGGGKAQAAGAEGGLGGMMFNAAGLHPTTVKGAMPDAKQFIQYRTPGDPLTGSQNSPAAQAALVTLVGPLASAVGGGLQAGDAIGKALGGDGLSPEMAGYADRALKVLPRSIRNIAQTGQVLPAAVGRIHEVPAIGVDGKPVAGTDLAGQHSIVSVINGIEQQKTEDLTVLTGAH